MDQLVRVGPVDRSNGLPIWYEDSTGLALDACLPNAQQLVDGTRSELLPINPAVRHRRSCFSRQYSPYSVLFTGTPTPTCLRIGGKAVLGIALEGAFVFGGVAAGDQMAFARLRILFDVPAPGGTYTVTTPFGVG